MSAVKKLVDGWSESMGALIGRFEGFDREERIIARAIVSTMRRQLRKIDNRDDWAKIERAFTQLVEKLPTANEGDLTELFKTDAFKQFIGDAGFDEDELRDLDMSELVEELHNFIQSGIVREILDGGIELARQAQRIL